MIPLGTQLCINHLYFCSLANRVSTSCIFSRLTFWRYWTLSPKFKANNYVLLWHLGKTKRPWVFSSHIPLPILLPLKRPQTNNLLYHGDLPQVHLSLHSWFQFPCTHRIIQMTHHITPQEPEATPFFNTIKSTLYYPCLLPLLHTTPECSACHAVSALSSSRLRADVINKLLSSA